MESSGVVQLTQIFGVIRPTDVLSLKKAKR